MQEFISIMLSNILNYQAALEDAFIHFLTEEGASEKTRLNYRSDLHHFFSWTITTVQSANSTLPQSHQAFMALLTGDRIEAYKQYLTHHQVPTSTINRRLSTIRTFFRCAIHLGWIHPSQVITVTNIKEVTHPTTNPQKILTAWQKELEHQGASKSTIRNYLTDVEKFLTWLQNK